MSDLYILKDRKPQKTDDLEEWGKGMDQERHVGDTTIMGIRISTVFLGIDHNYKRTGPPILYETMIFGGYFDQAQWRYETWEQAEIGHQISIARVKRTLVKSVPIIVRDNIHYILRRLYLRFKKSR